MSNGKNKSKDEFLNKLEIKIVSFQKILESNKYKHECVLMSSESAIYGTDVKIFTYDELEEFNTIVSFVLTYSPIGGNFSKSYIKNEIINLLHKVLAGKTSVSFELQSFYSDLMRNSNDESCFRQVDIKNQTIFPIPFLNIS